MTELQSNQSVTRRIRTKCVGCNGESNSNFHGSCTCGYYWVPIREWGIEKQKVLINHVRLVTERRNSND